MPKVINQERYDLYQAVKLWQEKTGEYIASRILFYNFRSLTELEMNEERVEFQPFISELALILMKHDSDMNKDFCLKCRESIKLTESKLALIEKPFDNVLTLCYGFSAQIRLLLGDFAEILLQN